MTMIPKEITTYCAQQQLDLSPIRREVLSFLWQCKKPVKAYDIIPYLKEQGIGSPVPMTVYRALDYLAAHHLVHKLHTLNAYIPCHFHKGLHQPATFLLCQDCGVVQEMCDDNAEKFVQTTAAKHHFAVEQQALELVGRCAGCSDG
jgi:Fur family zinc uptake transcriptional regulator